MKLLFPPALSDKDARAQQTILNNAQTFCDAGYVMTPVPHGWHGLYYVTSPRGDIYTVDACSRCTCPAFRWHGDCRHRLGVALHLGLVTVADLVVVRMEICTRQACHESTSRPIPA